MHIKSLIIAAVAATASAQDDPSVCDKYTKALLKENTAANQYTLLTLLVNTAFIGNYTGPGTSNAMLPGSMINVPGIVASDATYNGEDVNLVQYFNGDLLSTNEDGKPSSVNFLDGGGAQVIISNATSSGMEGSNQYRLLQHLYQYFGYLLGCSQYGMGAFPKYMGTYKQYELHKYMALSENEFGYFVQQVGKAALSFGATMDDVSSVAMSLNQTFGYRCSPEAKVVPEQPAALQAICIDDSCPKSPEATCDAYSAVMEPKTASMSGAASGTGSMMPTMTSGMASGSATTAGTPDFTGAAVAHYVPEAVMAGAAGLAAALAL